MDVGNNNHWDRQEVVTGAEVLATSPHRICDRPAGWRPRGHGPSTIAATRTGAAFGFVNSVTAPFCRNCNRLRLSADGKAVHLPLRRGRSRPARAAARAALDGETMAATIRAIWSGRDDRYSELRSNSSGRKSRRWKCPTSAARRFLRCTARMIRCVRTFCGPCRACYKSWGKSAGFWLRIRQAIPDKWSTTQVGSRPQNPLNALDSEPAWVSFCRWARVSRHGVKSQASGRQLQLVVEADEQMRQDVHRHLENGHTGRGGVVAVKGGGIPGER